MLPYIFTQSKSNSMYKLRTLERKQAFHSLCTSVCRQKGRWSYYIEFTELKTCWQEVTPQTYLCEPKKEINLQTPRLETGWAVKECIPLLQRTKIWFPTLTWGGSQLPSHHLLAHRAPAPPHTRIQSTNTETDGSWKNSAVAVAQHGCSS